MSPFRQSSAEARFWAWFTRNSERLFNFERDPEPIFDELSEALQEVAPGLTFEIGSADDGRREFIVSADGLLELFPAVERLVAAAPAMRQWTVIAFRPPRGCEFAIEIDGHRLSPDEVWFTAEADGELTGLVLYLPGLTPENEDALAQAAYLMLDTAIGEYATETLIGFIERRPLPRHPQASGLQPFRQLRAAIQGYGH